MEAYAFIDASNLFYGGRKSLGWSVDYQKLIVYLRQKYHVERAYFFGGVEIHHFEFDYLTYETVPISQLEMYLQDLIRKEGKRMTEARLLALDKQLKKGAFLSKARTVWIPINLEAGKNIHRRRWKQDS